MELLKNAWLGWGNYIQQGKLVILLPVALLFFLFLKKEEMKRSWIWYTAFMTAGCICPVTAAALMKYQTAFYDYVHIWSVVPTTAMIACGITSFLWYVWTEKEEKNNKSRAIGAVVLLGVVLLLCGNMGSPVVNQNDQTANYLTERERATKVVNIIGQLREVCGEDESLCLWAPESIAEYVRAADSSITLLYGRNMWDKSLNAYAYDVYTPEVEFLYRCMRDLENSGTLREDKISPETLAGMAQEAGADCILLPDSMERITVARMARSMGIRAQKLGDYWLLYESND